MASWLDKMLEPVLASLPKDSKVFRPTVAFHFGEVNSVIALVEEAIQRTQDETKDELHESALKAARDPNHNFMDNPVFAPMATAFWATDVTFPMILRRSLLVAIYSHIEHILQQWCLGLGGEWNLETDIGQFKKRNRNQPTPSLYLAYLRDEAKIGMGKFDEWPEFIQLDGYRRARNCLAHNGGIVDSQDDEAAITRLPNVYVDKSRLMGHGPIVLLERGACEAAAEQANQLFERLWEAYSKDPRVAPHL